MGSPQSLSEADRRVVAAWAADCAEHVLALFRAEAPDDDRPRALIARTRAFARGELRTADEIRRRFAGGVGAKDVTAPAAAAAARAAGQAVAVCHMGAHALGAAAYAAKAAGLADPGRPEAVYEEIRWQLDHMRQRSGTPCGHSRLSVRTRQARLGPDFSRQVNSASSSVSSRPISPRLPSTSKAKNRCLARGGAPTSVRGRLLHLRHRAAESGSTPDVLQRHHPAHLLDHILVQTRQPSR